MTQRSLCLESLCSVVYDGGNGKKDNKAEWWAQTRPFYHARQRVITVAAHSPTSSKSWYSDYSTYLAKLLFRT